MATDTYPNTLQTAVKYFSDLNIALAELVKLRWPDGVVRCPTCDSTAVCFLSSRRVWECKEKHSRRQFSIKVGTIMEDSALGIDKWLVAMWLLANAKNGISSYELGRAIGVTQKSAWFMLHRIRLAMQDDDGGKLGGDIEIDETYIGAKARNMHVGKKNRILQGRRGGLIGKTAVLGLLKRHEGASTVRLRVVKGPQRRHLMPHVLEHVESAANVYTDALPSYD